MKRVNVAFVGVGEFVTGNHLPNLKSCPERFNIKWLCDLNRELLADRTARFKPERSSTDVADILADPEVDLVLIGTRQDARLELIGRCAAAGKDIFVEKPMSLSTAESAEIVKAVRKAGVRLQVGYNRRFAPAVAEAKRLFSLFKSEAKRPATILYRVVDESYLWPDWAFDPAHGGKVFHEGCHFFDLACHLTGQFPVSLYTAGEVRDNQMSTLLFPDGTIFALLNGGEGSAAYPKERMEIFCGWNTLVMDNFVELAVLRQEKADTLRFPVFRLGGERTTAVMTPAELLQAQIKWRAGITEEEFAHRHYYSSAPVVDKGHLAQFDAIAQAIDENRPFPCNELDGAKATYLCEKCIESITTGEKVALSPNFLEMMDNVVTLR